MNSYEQVRDNILKVMHDHEKKGISTFVRSWIDDWAIAKQLRMDIRDVDEQLGILESEGVVDGSAKSSTSYHVRLTPQGKKRAREGFQNPPIASIGAIIHTMSGGTVQAVGQANYSTISQSMNDTQALRAEFKALSDQFVGAIQDQLPEHKIAGYMEKLGELERELVSRRPNESILNRMLGGVFAMSAAEGTIQFTARIAPVIAQLTVLAARIVQAHST